MSGIIFLILRFLLAAALYAFLGWSLLTLWRDLKFQREVVSTRHGPHLELRVQNEENLEPYRYNISEIIIGRDPNSDCCLQSEKVSANHALISFHHNQWWIEDLNSTNGSFLNNDPVGAPTVVVDGDHLRCGDVTLSIHLTL